MNLTAPDHIEEFYSMIGHSDVPYPVALGEKNVYFLIQNGSYGYVSRDHFENFPNKYSWGLDAYSRLWAQGPFMPDVSTGKLRIRAAVLKRNAVQKKASLEQFVKKIPKVKIIHKRPGWD